MICSCAAIVGAGCTFMVFNAGGSKISELATIIFFYFVELPAPFFLGVWFLMQFFQGAISITSAAGAGVAWWPHIGGFVVGFAVAWLLKSGHVTNPPVEQRRNQNERRCHYRINFRR